MLGSLRVVALRRKVEPPHTIVGFRVAIILIANRQRVIFRRRPVETRAEVGSLVRIGNCLDERGLGQGRIENGREHRSQVVDVPPIKVEEEGRALSDWPSNVSVVLRCIVCRFVGSGEQIRRVKGRIIAQHKELAVIFVGSRLGEDFYAAIAEFVVFGRKRVLVDTDLANRGLRRKLTRSEPVDIHLAAVRTCRRPCERLQIGL